MCRCRGTYGAPPVHSCLTCSVLSLSKSGHDLVTDFSACREPRTDAWFKPSVLEDELLTKVVCLWIQVTWKCDSEIVSVQLSHRTRSSTRAVIARAHQSWYRLLLKTIITFSGSGAELVRATQIVREMATAEQMQESLRQLQAQAARTAALETQLQIESARAQTPVQERSALIQTLVTICQERAEGMVEMKRISQPFILKGVG